MFEAYFVNYGDSALYGYTTDEPVEILCVSRDMRDTRFLIRDRRTHGFSWVLSDKFWDEPRRMWKETYV